MSENYADRIRERMVPFARTLGIEPVEVTQDKVVATVKVREDLSTSPTTMHGGAIMAVADTLGAVGAVVNMPKGAWTTTLESKTNFFRAIPVSTTMTAESTPLHKGRTTQVWQTRLMREDGKLAAVVTQTQMVLMKEDT